MQLFERLVCQADAEAQFSFGLLEILFALGMDYGNGLVFGEIVANLAAVA